MIFLRFNLEFMFVESMMEKNREISNQNKILLPIPTCSDLNEHVNVMGVTIKNNHQYTSFKICCTTFKLTC